MPALRNNLKKIGIIKRENIINMNFDVYSSTKCRVGDKLYLNWMNGTREDKIKKLTELTKIKI
jgi:hypothetical protein